MWHNHPTVHPAPCRDREEVCRMRRPAVRGESPTAETIREVH
jgi:hypothetical protein